MLRDNRGWQLELAGTIAIPVGLFIALLLGGISWIRQDKTTVSVTKVSEGQQHCQTCLQTMLIESTKQTTLLEEIAQNTRR